MRPFSSNLGAIPHANQSAPKKPAPAYPDRRSESRSFGLVLAGQGQRWLHYGECDSALRPCLAGRWPLFCFELFEKAWMSSHPLDKTCHGVRELVISQVNSKAVGMRRFKSSIDEFVRRRIDPVAILAGHNPPSELLHVRKSTSTVYWTGLQFAGNVLKRKDVCGDYLGRKVSEWTASEPDANASKKVRP